jgi:hypothetical protein
VGRNSREIGWGGGSSGEKLHYNAYEIGVFWRNCIIVQFLEAGKEEKGLTQRRREKIGDPGE